ncbi:MAG: DUF5810 domain-containing protein [Halobacteriales archaeon]|nr:DUF5810 domain-containing protein [Halobacteriales archaeon]
MGYACPVCDVPQADGEHLANHLAFTAMLHGEEHAAWLDETVTDWADMTVQELSAAVVQHATETDYTEVFEDTTGENPGPGRTPSGEDHHSHPEDHHDHAHDHGLDPDAARERASAARGPSDAETRRIFERARELTEAMQAEESDEDAESTADRED